MLSELCIADRSPSSEASSRLIGSVSGLLWSPARALVCRIHLRVLDGRAESLAMFPRAYLDHKTPAEYPFRLNGVSTAFLWHSSAAAAHSILQSAHC